MSSISVKWQGASSASARYLSHRQDVSSAIATLRSVKSYRCMRGRNFTSIYRALDREISRLEDEKRDLSSLENGLKDVMEAYKKCENEIVGKLDDGVGKKNPFEWTDQNWWDIISKAGFIGSGISAIGRLITGDWGWKVGIKSAKDLLSLVGGVSSAVAGKTGVTWKELLGFTDGLKGLDLTSGWSTFKSSLAKQFGKDLSFAQATTWGDKVKVATKWGGHILTLATNAFDNYDEFKGTGNVARGVSETVIETAVDIGVGALATAGVSCAAGWAAGLAAGTVLAPVLGSAVVIGAGAAAVTWAANGVCKWVTGGKDLGEVAADVVCDTAEKVGKAVGSAAKAVKKGWNAFTKWGKKCLGFG